MIFKGPISMMNESFYCTTPIAICIFPAFRSAHCNFKFVLGLWPISFNAKYIFVPHCWAPKALPFVLPLAGFRAFAPLNGDMFFFFFQRHLQDLHLDFRCYVNWSMEFNVHVDRDAQENNHISLKLCAPIFSSDFPLKKKNRNLDVTSPLMWNQNKTVKCGEASEYNYRLFSTNNVLIRCFYYRNYILNYATSSAYNNYYNPLPWSQTEP